MKNVNTFSMASTLRRDDPRRENYRQQRKERGFDDTELWSLDITILMFVLPRLKAFRDYTQSFPCDFSSFEEWQAVIDKMIFSIETIIKDDYDELNISQALVAEGLELFYKYFRNLFD